MDALRDTRKSALLDDVAARLSDTPEAAGFSRLLFARGAEEDLVALAPATLADLAAATLERIRQRRPGIHRIEILDGVAPDQTIVEILNDDMPFLVDTVLGELTETGCDIHLVLHPIVPVARTGDGRLERFGAEAGSGAARESLIQIHVGRIASVNWRTALAARLDQALADVRLSVIDWRAMLSRVDEILAQYRRNPPPLPPAEIAEATAFLEWLRDDNFIFLGTRDYRRNADGSAERIEGTSLGVLRDQGRSVLKRGDQTLNTSPQMKAFLAGPRPLIITKSSLRSNVHRRVPMDYVGVKLYGADGALAGEVRLLGLFTSTAYTRSTRTIPYVRHKVDGLFARSGFDQHGHSGKVLINVLENLPRDELFQMDDDTLADFAFQIMSLEERPRIRVLSHNDPFDRYTTVLVHVPRERYTTEVRHKVGAYLEEAFGGRVTFAQPTFLEGGLARIHFTIAYPEGGARAVPQAELETRVTELTRTWADRLIVCFDQAGGDSDILADRYQRAFPATYQATYAPVTAVADSAVLERLGPARELAADFIPATEPDAETGLRLKLYHRGGPIPLSDRVPVLENMGLRVIDEQTFEIQPTSRPLVHLHDMSLNPSVGDTPDAGRALLTPAAIERLEAGFMAVWEGRAEDDGFNRLLLAAGLGWRDVALLRALTRYLRQIGLTYTLDYVAGALVRYPDLARLIVERFHAAHDPDRPASIRDEEVAKAGAAITTALDAVASLDDDTIIRRLDNLVAAILRTNLYKIGADGQPLETLAFKIDSRAISDMPSPRPLREIWVYSPRVEGVHLRFAKVARGGLRWSDRPQDFRTEVLGLVKAQQVKNAVIVPAGAKGGFVPRRLKPGMARDAFMAEGTEAYRIFIRSLLGLTDNLDAAGNIVPPERVVRLDGDDPYLVVAADKGTATFSDTANAIAIEHGFWLGDAFASGGSVGYDHKKMGITARGAFEAVRRHFREIDIDIDTTPFTVAGVGDMSGDVFGNGMLLAPTIKLVAAFDHRDIFIDPTPDPAASLNERQRLFDLPRSSWADYDRSLISAGGGVFSRSLKHIDLSDAARAALGIQAARLTPAELIRAILRAPVDLLWFGGIGTYIRAAEESDAEVGDRANDAVRVTAGEIRARIIGEGANLGVTQRARIAYGLAGGRCNSDAIDNSAGVNCSDVEVNIKIALGGAIGAGRLVAGERPALLAALTDEVAGLVLANNRSQTLAIGVESALGLSELPRQTALMHQLAASGLLDRAVEFLPDDAGIARRQSTGHGLTRSEIGVLLAYAKMALKESLLGGEAPDDPFLRQELTDYFPDVLAERFPEAIARHRLAREIVATRLANAMIDRGGTTFVSRLVEETGATPSRIALAFAAARVVFGFDGLVTAVEAATGPTGAERLAMHGRLRARLVDATIWFLRNETFADGLTAVIDRLAGPVAALVPDLASLVGDKAKADIAARAEGFAAAGFPADVAARIAGLPWEITLVDAMLVAAETGLPASAAASRVFAVAERFDLDAVAEASRRIVPHDRFDAMVLERARAGIGAAQRRIAVRAGEDLDAFAAARPLAGSLVAELREIGGAAQPSVSSLAVAAGLMQDLAAD